MSDRISLTTKFEGNYKHLKRNIKNLLKSRGVGHILQTIQLNDSQKQTTLFMEGESTSLYTAQTELVSHLKSIYPDICIQNWDEEVSKFPIDGSRITPTPGSLSSNSSGFVQELDETLVDQTQQPEQKNSISFNQIFNAIQNGHQVAHEIYSSISSIHEKFVHITYRRTTVYLNIGACITWDQLLKVIQDSKILQIKQPISGVYSVVGGKKSYIQDWYGLEAKGQYYVETEEDLVQKFSPEMEEFFVKLKTDQDMSDDHVEIVKEKFGEQGITFKHLMATGELSLTDQKLKEYGIAQGGLRTSILSVIKSNQ